MILAMIHRRWDLWWRQTNSKSLRYCSSSKFGPKALLTLTILIVQMLHSLRRRRSHASNLNGISRRKMFERAVQTSPDVEASDSSGSRNINSSAPAKVSPCLFSELLRAMTDDIPSFQRLTKAATINGVTRQNTLTDLTSTSATPIPTVIITQRKHSVQSTQPETSVRELRSKSRNVAPESSSASVPSGVGF